MEGRDLKDYRLTDGVFSRPFVPGTHGLPRERLHRYSGEEPRTLRIKTERDMVPDMVKLEPYFYPKGDGAGVFPPPPSHPPRRRDSLPADYMSYRRVEFESTVPLNLAEPTRLDRRYSEPRLQQDGAPLKEEMFETETLAGQDGYLAEPRAGGFGEPEPRTGGFGAVEPRTGGFGAPDHKTDGFGAPEPRTDGFGEAKDELQGGEDLYLEQNEGNSSRTVIGRGAETISQRNSEVSYSLIILQNSFSCVAVQQ